jgi:hypothetical protein
MSAPTLLQKAVPLSSERHGQSFLNTQKGYGFARQMSAVPVLVREFTDLSRDYVTAFMKAGDEVRAVALLGLAENENLYLDANDAWQADYVPAMLRQYPFVAMLEKGAGTGILAIAEDYSGLNTDGQGTALFDADGRPGDLVSRAQKFVADVAQGALRTESFCARLTALDLLTPIAVEMKSPSGTSRRISGVMSVDRKKLADLGAEDVHDLHRSGALEAIHMHLLSLRNLRALAGRITPESASATALN